MSEIHLGMHLLTKDGRKVGNARVMACAVISDDPKQAVYFVMTDFGNTMTLTGSEIESLFYLGREDEAFNPPAYPSLKPVGVLCSVGGCTDMGTRKVQVTEGVFKNFCPKHACEEVGLDPNKWVATR